VSGFPAQDRRHHQRRLRNSDRHILHNHNLDERHQNPDDHHRFLAQNCRENHRHHQSAHDRTNIVSAVGRDFYEKENIDAPLDSANDHVVHRTSHIHNIHQHRLLDSRVLLYQWRGSGGRLVVHLRVRVHVVGDLQLLSENQRRGQ